MQLSVQIQSFTVCKASNAINKLCAGQATKNVLVDHSAEPLRVHWDGEMANEQNIEAKHVQTCSNSDLCEMAKIQ